MSSIRRRKFTEEDKKAILAEADKRGISTVLREHRLSYSVFSRWKERMHASDNNEAVSQYKLQQQLKNLLLENERLKKIIANLALENQIKTEKLNNTGII